MVKGPWISIKSLPRKMQVLSEHFCTDFSLFPSFFCGGVGGGGAGGGGEEEGKSAKLIYTLLVCTNAGCGAC